MAESEQHEQPEPSTAEKLAAVRARLWELELEAEKRKLREPFIDALVRAAEAEAKVSYFENRVSELEVAAGRHGRIRDAQTYGLSSISRGDLQRIVDQTLHDPQAMQELREEKRARRQREHAEAIEEAEAKVKARRRSS